MPNLSDVLTLPALLPAGVVFFANVVAIQALWSAQMSKVRFVFFWLYTVLNVCLTIGLVFYGATQVQNNRAETRHSASIEQKIDTIRAVLGSAPNTSGDEVLDHIIAKFSQPQVISPAQMAKMAEEISFLKDELPQTVVIYRSTTNSFDSADWSMYNPLYEMFARNGLLPVVSFYTPTSVDETGLMIIVRDPLHPPDYAVKLQSAFELAGMLNIQFKNIPALESPNTISFFVGPPPI